MNVISDLCLGKKSAAFVAWARSDILILIDIPLEPQKHKTFIISLPCRKIPLNFIPNANTENNDAIVLMQ